MTEIVGIALVRNEDLYLRHAITNVAEFCDRIIILDNCSTDQTAQEIESLKSTYQHVEAYGIKDYRDSHEFIASYAGSQTWVLGVDGDELYDPRGLAELRKKLVAGEFSDYWAILGNVVHCIELKHPEGVAIGYPSPPSRSMTKLFNFSILKSWDSRCERLHGEEKEFRPGYSENQRLSFHEQVSWNESMFRCLHLCFIRRSSIESIGKLSRLQPDEKPEWMKRLDRLGVGWMLSKAIQSRRSLWKDDKYRRGKLVEVDATPFFSRP